MKYLYLILTIILLSSCTYKEEKEDYNFIPNNTIRFIKTKEDSSLLINKDEILYLVVLNRQNIDIDTNYLININDIEKDLIINDISFKVSDKVEININNYNFCIYIKEIDNDNYTNCDFIYLYNPDNNFYITLNRSNLVLFYEEYTKFNYKFTYELSTTWIDSYTISNTSYTDLILDDNFKVVSHKIRGKTIHKR